MKNLEQNSYTIFLWHRPVDKKLARLLAEDLRAEGFVVSYIGETEKNIDLSFHTTDWQLAKSDCVIFLISESAVRTPRLRSDAEKVMRRGDVLLVPAYIDKITPADLPMILQYIEPIDFIKGYKHAFEHLVEITQSKQSGEKISLSPYRMIWAKPLKWLVEHFRRYLTLSPLTFSWQITVENLVVSLAVTGLIYLLWSPAPRTNLENITASNYLWSIIILGPIVETILLQVLPVFVARTLGLKFYGQLLFSIIPFASLHFTRSIGAGIGAGIIGGFYSAFTYVHWRDKSIWTAIWVTAFSHCLYNLALFAMLIGEF